MKVIGNIFAAMGLLAFGYWTLESVSARLYQAQETRRFVRERQAVVPGPVKFKPINQPYPINGSAVAMLAIPRLELSVIVVEGADERELKLGPGHIRGTSFPGEGGNVGVAGHRDTFFRPLRLIRRDDAIRLVTPQREYEYRVVSTELVEPDDIRVLQPTGHEMLTLVTCYPFDFVGPAPKRFIIHADCVGCPR